MLIRGQVLKHLHEAGGPLDLERLDLRLFAQAEVNDVRHLRTIGIDRVHFADDLLAVDLGHEAGADALAVAGRRPGAGLAAEGDLQIVLLREIILVKNDGAAADLPHHQVQLAVVAEIARDHRAAIAVVVGPGQVADLEEVAAADFPRHIQVNALALVAAQVVPLLKDFPGSFDAEFAQARIDFAGSRNAGLAIRGL